MRISNTLARKYLLSLGYNEVWLKPHTKFHDTVYTFTGENYKALDLFNLWDGIALHDTGVFFIQIKTNAWPKEQPIVDWCNKYKARGLAINVKADKLNKDEYKCHMRVYEY